MVYTFEKYEITINFNKHNYCYNKMSYDSFGVNIIYALTNGI